MDCIFCKIINKEIPAKIIFEDEKILAFKDVNPKSKVHVLIIPKKHIASVNEINSKNSEIIAYIFEKTPTIAVKLGISDGYKILNNCGEKGGQLVFHLHFHLMSEE